MINIDCMDWMRVVPDDFYDIAIVDPPYGIGEGRRVRSRTGVRKVRQANGTILRAPCDRYELKDWDNDVPDRNYWNELFRVSKHQIVWGVNNFPHVGWKSGRIFWDKVNGDNDFSDGELAYCSFHLSVRKFTYMWNGMMQGKSLAEPDVQQGNKRLNEKRIHKTQKPVLLYKWLLDKYANPGDKILDTHGGSGTICIACDDMGYDLDWMERDPDIFAAAVKYTRPHLRQLKAF